MQMKVKVKTFFPVIMKMIMCRVKTFKVKHLNKAQKVKMQQLLYGDKGMLTRKEEAAYSD